MNNTEGTLLIIAFAILLGLIVYSIIISISSSRSRSRSSTSQAESLKSMLDEYAQKVLNEKCTIDEKFEFLNVDIPTKQYPHYDNARAVDEMGLTQEEADAFVLDLVKAIDAEIPQIEEAILSCDYKTIEEIVHTITGSSSTLGSGGVSSALISFYAAVQHRDSLQKLYIHLQNVKYYLSELKDQVNVEN